MENYLNKQMENKVKYFLPEYSVASDLADFFSVFSDGTRLRLLSALSISDMCVTDLANVLDLNQTTVSHQLKLLKSVGVVDSVRYGKSIFYSINNKVVKEVMMCGVNYLGY